MIISPLDAITAGIKGPTKRFRIYVTLPAGVQPGASGITAAGAVANDFATSTGAGTALLFSTTIPAGYRVGNVTVNLGVPLDSADSAFTSCALLVGDNASTSTFLGSTELNARGTYILTAGNGTCKDYAAADVLKFTVTPTSAKALSNLTVGWFDIDVLFTNVADISNS